MTMAFDQKDSQALGLDLRGRLKELDALDAVADRFGSTLTSGLKAAVLQGKSLDDTLKTVALRLSSTVLEASLKPLVSLFTSETGSLGSLLSGVLGFAKGGVVPFADGGVVRTPTYFPLGDGLGVAGEAGAEAILPLARGADGNLGVRGGGGVNVTFNVTTPNVQSFRQSEAQVGMMLARAVGRGRRGL
jgi:phage-related minor tail protein